MAMNFLGTLKSRFNPFSKNGRIKPEIHTLSDLFAARGGYALPLDQYVPTLIDPRKWPTFRGGYTEHFFNSEPHGHMDAPSFFRKLLVSRYWSELTRDMLDIVHEEIPPQSIRALAVTIRHGVLYKGGAAIGNRDHKDKTHVAAAAFPLVTIDSRTDEEVTKPGMAAIWDGDFKHRAPRNKLTTEEWRERLQDTPGANKIIGENGRVERMFIAMELDLDPDFIEDRIASIRWPTRDVA